VTATNSPRRFAAFISYRHLDNTDEGRRWAEWLHHWIESYRVPRPLVGAEGEFGSVPPRVAPVFRDEWEMRGGGELAMLIEEGLRGSECLIVLCTPRSAVSPWVIDEVTKFKALGKEHRMIPVLIEGEPGAADAASDDAERAARECLPATLRRGVRAVGPPTADGLYPLDVTAPFALTPCDFRPKGTHDMGYTNAAAYRESLERAGVPKHRHRDLEERYAERLRLERLRIMAGLLGVPLDELNQRDAAERARRWRQLFFISAAVVAVIAFLAVSAVHKAAMARSGELSAESLRLTQAEPTRAAEAMRDAIGALDLNVSPASIHSARSALSLWPCTLRRVRPDRNQTYAGAAVAADGTRYAICGDGVLLILDVSTGKVVTSQSAEGYGGWSDVKFSADSRWLAVTQFRGGKVDLFEARSGRRVREFGHQSPWKLAWHPRDSVLAVSGPAEVVFLELDSAGNPARRRAFTAADFSNGEQRAKIADASFSAEGTSLAVACMMEGQSDPRRSDKWGSAHSFAWPELTKIGTAKIAAPPTAIAIDHATSRLAVIDSAEVLTVWDFARGDVLWSSGALGVNLGTPTTPAIRSTLSFSADGKHLISASLSPGLRVWEAASGRETTRVPSNSPVLGMTWVRGDSLYFASSRGGVWESSILSGDAQISGRATLQTPARTMFVLRDAICFSQDEGFVLVKDNAPPVTVHAQSLQLGHPVDFDSRSRSLAFMPDAQTIAIGEKRIGLSFGQFLPENARVFKLSPGAKLVSVAGAIGLFEVYDTASGRKVWELPAARHDPPRFEKLIWDVSGRAVAAGGTVFDLNSGRVATLRLPEMVELVAASGQFSSVICAGANFVGRFAPEPDGTLREVGRVSLPNGRRETLPSSSGRYLCAYAQQVTGSGGSLIDLFSFREICRISEGNRVTHASFDDDEARLAVLCENGQCLIYTTAKGELVDRWRTSLEAKWIGWTPAAEVVMADAAGRYEIRSLEPAALRAECARRLASFEE
jgi:WD40 repeat protein